MMLARGICSTDSRVSASNSRCSVSTGANPTPQLPTTTVVVPCQHAGVPRGSQSNCASRCVWGSTNPGVTNRPRASRMRRADPPLSPTETMRSPSIATSPTKPGAPLPSITVPFRIKRSCTVRTPRLPTRSRNLTACGKGTGNGARSHTARAESPNSRIWLAIPSDSTQSEEESDEHPGLLQTRL